MNHIFLFKEMFSDKNRGDKIMKNNIEVVAAEIVPEIIGEYIQDMGFKRQDHIFIRKVGRHIEIGEVKFRCVE
jgi:hypothetical protein